MGRETGVSKGMGGSMHLFDIENGLMGGNGIVGGGLTLALGTAYASRYRDLDRVTVCFFSEGASNQGTFHESINMAALWRLPIVYICENNLFAATTPSYKTLSHPDVARRATGYGIPGIIADGNDVNDVYEKTLEAVERARKGQGPTLLECKTYRVEGHCMVLKDLPQHRPRKEVEGWQDRDPIDLLEKELMKEKGTDLNIRGVVFEEVQEEFKAAIEYAKSSRKPDCDAFDRIVKERYPL
jgi:TPP-dependent pyruvate/acetoin dehydrogenase alpha subunit